MNNHPHIAEESDDGERTEGVQFPSIDTSDRGESFASVGSSTPTSRFEVSNRVFTVVVNNSSSSTSISIRFSNRSKVGKTLSDDSIANHSSFSVLSTSVVDTKTSVEVPSTMVSKGLESGNMPPTVVSKGSEGGNVPPTVVSSTLLNNNLESTAVDGVLLNGNWESTTGNKVLLNNNLELTTVDRVSHKKKPLKTVVDGSSLWSERQFAFANEQALLDLAQFMAERKRLRREFPQQLAKSPTQIQKWRRWARRKKLGGLAVLLSILRCFEVMAIDLLSVLDALIELSAEGAFYTNRYTTDYSIPASTHWTGSYTSSVPPPYPDNYNSTDAVKHTEVCNVKIKTRKAKIEVHLHSFYKGVSMTVVAGRAPPSPIRLAA